MDQFEKLQLTARALEYHTYTCAYSYENDRVCYFVYTAIYVSFELNKCNTFS